MHHSERHIAIERAARRVTFTVPVVASVGTAVISVSATTVNVAVVGLSTALGGHSVESAVGILQQRRLRLDAVEAEGLRAEIVKSGQSPGRGSWKIVPREGPLGPAKSGWFELHAAIFSIPRGAFLARMCGSRSRTGSSKILA